MDILEFHGWGELRHSAVSWSRIVKYAVCLEMKAYV